MTCYDFLAPSSPSDLTVNLQFVDYKPVVTINWSVSIMYVVCSCMCVFLCGMHAYVWVENAI